MADSNPAKEFLNYLTRHNAVREVLKDGLVEDIVAEGAARGYLFDAEQLRSALVNEMQGKGEWQQVERPTPSPRRKG